jgi:dCMP deaminase
MSRISFAVLGLNVAKECAKRSEDLHKKVGCCIMNKEGRILSTGYNGLLPKVNMDKKFWLDREFRRKYIIHAEINALSRIKREEEPYIIASTLLPCSACALNIASYGIKKVFYMEDYHNDKGSYDIFNFYKIDLIKI